MKKLLVALVLCLIPALAGASTVVLTWNPNTDANLAGYKVYYANTNVQPFTGSGAVQGASGKVSVLKGTNTATLSGLDPTKPYFMAVTAYNTAGQESIYSNVVNIPILPVQITGVTSADSKGTITISWPPVATAQSYNLYWSKSTGVTITNGTKVAGVVSPYTLSNLADGTAYYFIVTGVNGVAEGFPSAEMTDTTPIAPNPVINLNCVCTPQ
jgi:hypothetical protein